MSKIIFILGAGASAHCGTPLMSNFLDVARDLWMSGQVDEAKEHFEGVFKAIGKLQGIHSKAKLDTYNIETVYAAFEMGKLLGKLPGITDVRDIEPLTVSIRKVIGYTLERTMKIPANVQGTIEAPAGYLAFANIVRDLVRNNRNCSIISFNYDLGLDYSLHMTGISSDYGLGDGGTGTSRVTYLKLHGSINWGRCASCQRITPYRSFQYTTHTAGTNYSTLPILDELSKHKCRYCNGNLGEDPFIVPPTWNKTIFHEQIQPVWQRAALELNDAEHIFVLGYSMPTTDQFFNYLFALGVDMTTWLRGFYVYDIDTAIEKRFENLLGSGILQRFSYSPLTFEHAVQNSLSPDENVQYISFGKQVTIPQILRATL